MANSSRRRRNSGSVLFDRMLLIPLWRSAALVSWMVLVTWSPVAATTIRLTR
jgi:hypothetical protein